MKKSIDRMMERKPGEASIKWGGQRGKLQLLRDKSSEGGTPRHIVDLQSDNLS